MSLVIYVDAYTGYKATERPRQFCVDEDVFQVSDVEDRWYDLEADYFKVRNLRANAFFFDVTRQAANGHYKVDSMARHCTRVRTSH